MYECYKNNNDIEKIYIIECVVEKHFYDKNLFSYVFHISNNERENIEIIFKFRFYLIENIIHIKINLTVILSE